MKPFQGLNSTTPSPRVARRYAPLTLGCWMQPLYIDFDEPRGNSLTIVVGPVGMWETRSLRSVFQAAVGNAKRFPRGLWKICGKVAESSRPAFQA